MNSRSAIIVLCVILVAFALVLLVTGALTTNKDDINDDEIATDDQEETSISWTAALLGVNFEYEIVNTINLEEASSADYDYPYYYVWNGRTCDAQFTFDFIREAARTELVGAVSEGAAYCAAQAQQNDGEQFPNLPEYTRAWSELYREQCGNKLQPLGWEPEHDGSCEIPDLSQVEL